jgi:hypothetical protein
MRLSIIAFTVALLIAAALPAAAQKNYSGPRPEKSDVPFLQHGKKLIEVETSEAGEAQGKGDVNYSVPGANSPTKTPVPEPLFLFQSDKLNPQRLSLFRMKIKGGQRTLSLPTDLRRRKDKARPLFILVSPIENRLFKVEVNEPLENGEYCLSPEGSNKVFCFSEY